MTREEAIKILQDNTNLGYGIIVKGYTKPIQEAFDMAIKALEQEPCEDCINRKKAVFALNDAQVEYDENYKGLGKAKEIIDNLPPVQPIRSEGKWIEHPHEAGANWEFSMYECSECHVWEEDDSNYCPNCGADMRGEKDER